MGLGFESQADHKLVNRLNIITEILVVMFFLLTAKIQVMRIKLFFLLTLIAGLFSFSSCSDDEHMMVKYVVRSNTPGAPIAVSYSHPRKELVIKDYWERTFVIERPLGTSVWCEGKSEDPNVLITCELYIDGKLRAKEEGNKSVSVEYYSPIPNHDD